MPLVTDVLPTVKNWYKTPLKPLASSFRGGHGLFGLIPAAPLIHFSCARTSCPCACQSPLLCSIFLRQLRSFVATHQVVCAFCFISVTLPPAQKNKISSKTRCPHDRSCVIAFQDVRAADNTNWARSELKFDSRINRRFSPISPSCEAQRCMKHQQNTPHFATNITVLRKCTSSSLSPLSAILVMPSILASGNYDKLLTQDASTSGLAAAAKCKLM